MHHHMRNPGFFRNMTNLSKLALLIAAVLSLCVLPLDTAAQEARATLGGRVTDPQGAAVPEAIVAVTSDDTGVAYQTQTSAQGSWIIEFLLPGHYRFSVTKLGFRVANRLAIRLQTADKRTSTCSWNWAPRRNPWWSVRERR
jgi:Carboxypeptidase regulatory-like domain